MKQLLLISLGIFYALLSHAQTGTVADFHKISSESETLNLGQQANFGYVSETATENIIFLGAPNDGNGQLFVAELNEDGSPTFLENYNSSEMALFDGQTNARFGESAIETGSSEYIVGAPGFNESGSLFKISNLEDTYIVEQVNLPELLATGSEIGSFISKDGDELLIYSALNQGSIYRCNLDGLELTIIETIGANNPFLSEKLEEGDRFGSGLSVYDINDDGNLDILCGAPGDDDQNEDYGAVYLLYRNESKEITGVQKLSRLEGDFGGFMNSGDEFGISVRGIGDLDENGADDLAIGAPGDDDGGLDIGAVWIVFMREDGSVRDEKKINRLEGNFDGDINFQDQFGQRIATVGDLNEDGTVDIVSGSILDDDGGTDLGAAYTIFIERCPSPSGDFEFEVEAGTVSFFAEGGEGYSYIWNFDDGGYSEEQNPVHTYESNGTYWVCLAINNDCGGNNFCKNVTVSTLSLEENLRSQTKIYPNPAKEFINLSSPELIESVSILDITGKTIFTQNPERVDIQVQTAQFPTGIYILNWESQGYTFTERIQVVR